jgi:hypothetical protein
MNRNKVQKLHDLRQAQADVKDTIEDLKLEWERSNASTLQQADEINKEIETLEEEIRAERVDLWDGEDKSKILGIGIQERTQLEYDGDQALRWAIHHELALKLDKRKFESIAKDGDVDFVVVRHVPTATIATDLGKYLEGQDGVS